jgi:protein-S-isoprenylcysteine O-methyltransferase Ste14
MAGRWRVFLGFVAAAMYAVFAHVASPGRLAAGLGISLAGLLLRGWAAGHLEKGKRLAQDGPYAFMRHPLYTGSFLLALGFVVAGTGSPAWIHGLIIWSVFLFLFFGVYPRRIRQEEQSLEKYFGDAWREFTRRNHRFLPRLVPVRRPDPSSFEWARYRKNREYQALLGWLAGVLALYLKSLAEHAWAG